MDLEAIVFKDFNIVANGSQYIVSEVIEDIALTNGGAMKRKKKVRRLLKSVDCVMPLDFSGDVNKFTAALVAGDKYRLVVYAGPKVINSGRTEHKCRDGNYHVHFKNSSGVDIQVNCGTLEEINGKKLPKDLKKYLGNLKKSGNENLLSQIARDYYEKGEINDKAIKKLKSG